MKMKCTCPVQDFIRLLQVRYHHDGKYNVMSLEGPIEIHGKARNYIPFQFFAASPIY